MQEQQFFYLSRVRNNLFDQDFTLGTNHFFMSSIIIYAVREKPAIELL